MGSPEGLELISKRPQEDDDHPELEERQVVVGLAVATGSDPPQRFQPGVRALDRPALAGLRVARLQPPLLSPPDLVARLSGRDRLPALARLGDPGADPPLGQRPLVRTRGVASVCPQLPRMDAGVREPLEQRQQVALLVFVPGRERDRERQPAGIDG
jgi:hypothetical protein